MTFKGKVKREISSILFFYRSTLQDTFHKGFGLLSGATATTTTASKTTTVLKTTT